MWMGADVVSAIGRPRSRAASGMAQGIAAALAAIGVHVTVEWVTACAAHLTRAQPAFAAMPPKQQAGECYLQFLECDLNVAGAGYGLAYIAYCSPRHRMPFRP